MNAEDVGKQLVAMLQDEAEQFGASLEASGQMLSAYTASRVDHLKNVLAANEPGFMNVVRTESHNILHQTGLQAGAKEDELKARLTGVAIGVLTLASQALGELGPPTT